MTTVSELGRGQPSLADRLVTLALTLSIDPATTLDSATEALVHLSRGSCDHLERALRRARARGGDRPSQVTARAVELLRLALEHLVNTVAPPTSPEGRTS
jgi:hypothetical protein